MELKKLVSAIIDAAMREVQKEEISPEMIDAIAGLIRVIDATCY